MNIVRFIKNRMGAVRRAHITDAGHDLALYRELRRAESNLYAARECLERTLAAQRAIPDGFAPGMQDGDAHARPYSAGCPNLHRREIEHLQHDVARCEAEYQCAQMNVRAYFYLESCPGRMPEIGLASGHPAQ